MGWASIGCLAVVGLVAILFAAIFIGGMINPGSKSEQYQDCIDNAKIANGGFVGRQDYETCRLAIYG